MKSRRAPLFVFEYCNRTYVELKSALVIEDNELAVHCNRTYVELKYLQSNVVGVTRNKL